MNWNEQFEIIDKKISKSLRKNKDRESLAQKAKFFDVSIGKYRAWADGQRPSADDLETIARKLGFSPRWLLLGEGEPEVEAAPTAADQQAQPGQDDVAGRLLRKRSLGGVPLAGLASCGLREWGTPSPLAVRAARPADLNHPDAFAVMATGDSMVPAGIREGYLLYCDPGNPPDVGDAVYVELANKSATVKILEGLDSETLRLRGWLPPDGQGHQKHYFEETPARLVTRIATVVWVRRKL